MTKKDPNLEIRDVLITAQKDRWHRARKRKEGQPRDAGPHGVTRELILDGIRQRFSRKGITRKVGPNDSKVARDRSLSGKARVKARKARNKEITAKVNAGQW